MFGLLAFTEQGTSQFHAPGGGSAALVHAEQTPLPCSTKAGYLRVPTSVLAQDLLKSGKISHCSPAWGCEGHEGCHIPLSRAISSV